MKNNSEKKKKISNISKKQQITKKTPKKTPKKTQSKKTQSKSVTKNNIHYSSYISSYKSVRNNDKYHISGKEAQDINGKMSGKKFINNNNNVRVTHLPNKELKSIFNNKLSHPNIRKYIKDMKQFIRF